MFCVQCGKETTEELRGGLCSVCFLEKNTLASLPEHVDFEVCVFCRSRKRGEIWVSGFGAIEPLVEEAVREAIDWDRRVDKPHAVATVIAEDERNYTVNVAVSGLAEGLPFEQHLATRSRLKNATCVRCSRVQGGYYEAIVQVRAAKRPLDPSEMKAVRGLAYRMIDRIVSDGDRNAFVLRDEEIHGGLDVYMGTTNAGRMLVKQIAQEYGGKTSEHAKTVGQKDGLDLIRMTFAVRLPEYRAGDYVIVGDEVLEVSSISPKQVVVIEAVSGKTRHVERAVIDKALVIPRHEAQDAVVVSQTETELQLLDPRSYQTVTALRPEGLGEVGDTVPVLRHEEELYVLRPRRGQDG